MPYDWAVQQLRLSLFTNEPVVLTEKDWKTLTGQDEAENRVAIPGGKQFSGGWMGGLFSMGYAANRVDYVLNYNDSAPDLTLDTFVPAIGDWNELSISFGEAMRPILANFSFPIVRIAIGAVLLLPTGDRSEAYSKLDDLLISVNVDSKSKEVTFRINWPRMSKAVEGLELNRITAWSCVNFHRAIMQFTGANVGITAPADPKAQFVRLELDHNTALGQKEPFAKAKLVPIFEELLGLAQENADQGECQ